MAYKRKRDIKLPAPYLKRVWLDLAHMRDSEAYPFCLPFLRNGFELDFDMPVTIIMGENGAGKSTLLEGIAVLAGFDEGGGANGYRAVDHSRALEATGGKLAQSLRAAWLPKITTGWFFRAESFFSAARWLDQVARTPPDFLSHSHGEGFLRFFEERCQGQGFFIFDEPESALSPTRQLELLRLLRRIDRARNAQVILATHSPMLMACPNARLLELTKYGLAPTVLEDTTHYRLLREFCASPKDFVESLSEEE